MQLLYGGKAREAGVYIIGACGFDSVPSDMGVAFTRENFSGRFPIPYIKFQIALSCDFQRTNCNVSIFLTNYKSCMSLLINLVKLQLPYSISS